MESGDITDSLKSIIINLTDKPEDESIAQECFRFLIQFNKNLEEDEISQISLDNYLLFIFNKEYGISRFLRIVLPKNTFSKAKLQCLKLYYLLVNNFSMKMEKYFPEMNEECLMILKNYCTTSDEKVKALTLLYIMLEKININFKFTNDYLSLYKTLHHCRDLKFGESISEKIYECLGLYVERLDYTLKPEDARNLLNHILFKIKEEMSSISYSKKLVAGLFTSLKHIQTRVSFDHIDKRHIDELYVIIKKLSKDAFHNKIKITCRAALLFLQRNVSLFNDKLFLDHKFWHDTLLKWIHTLGAEEKKIASQVILCIYICVSGQLMREKKQEHTVILKNYLGGFRQMLDKETSSTLEKQTCIHGIRIFFKSASSLLSATDISNFSLKLLHAFRITYVVDQENFTSDEWSLLPDYIPMITSVIIVKGIDKEGLLLLKQSLILLLKHYSCIPILNRIKVNEAFLVTLQMVMSYDFFDSFLGDLIYHGVIWSCSHQHIAELDKDTQEIVTVLNYFPFWKDILNSDLKNNSEDNKMNIEERRLMTALIVKNLIATLFICINKLDITITYKQCYSTCMKQSVEMNKKNDYVIFLNIVDFYEQVFLFIKPQFLHKYIGRLLNFFMGHSLEYPLISGFYRLLAICLRIASELSYFNQTVLLECPANLIEEMLPACIPAFITIFSIGRHYLPVADLGIQTLENWQKSIKQDLLEDFVGKIVDKLGPFLRSKSLAYLAPEIRKPIKYNRALRKRKMVFEIEPELIKLQRKMVRFLGRQTTSVCEKLLDGQRIVTDVWSDAQHLKFTLSFPDMKLDIFLDQMIPPVVELALYCTDRKTRVIACELLQGLVILFLGISKQITDKEERELGGVMKKSTSAILELGCDPDEVVRGLFEPLILQMIHWYSTPYKSAKYHTAIILEALTEGVCCTTNPNVRSFSGKCIGEFVKWTIKQSTEASLQQNPLNVKILIRKMRFLSTHPEQFKKLGAAIMFNNFYIFLREEKSLLNIFWIEIFEIFISSLHFIENNFENRLIISEVNIALKHLQRGFVEKACLFRTKDEKRRKPHGFEGTTCIDIMKFLLGNVRSRNSLCREKSAELFSSLLPYFSSMEYFHNIQNDPSYWLKTTSEISTNIELTELNKITDLFQWMSELQRGLDGLIFFLENAKVINQNLNDADVVQSICYYLKFVATRSIEEIIESANEKQMVISVIDKRTFKNEKKLIDRKFLIFSHRVLNKNCEIEHLWNRELWSFIVHLLFDLRDDVLEEDNNKKQLECFLKCAIHKLPEEKREELKEHLIFHIKNNFSDDLELNSPISVKQKKIIYGMIILKNCGYDEIYNFSSLYPQILQKFIRKCLLKSCKNEMLYLNEEELYYYNMVWKFSLQNEFKEFVYYLFHTDKVEDQEERGKVSIGSFLLNNFEDVIIPKLIENFDQFLKLSTSSEEFTSDCILYIKRILMYISRFKGNISWPAAVSKKIEDNWKYLRNFLSRDFSSLLEGLELIESLNSIGKSNFLTSSSILIILENNEFISFQNPFQPKLQVLEFLFKHLDSTTEEKYSATLRAVINQIVTEISQEKDRNAQNLCLIKISKLYQTLGESRSILLFELVINLFLKFTDFGQYVKDVIILKTYVKRLSEKDQLEIMTTLVNELKNPTYSTDLKMKLGKDILVTVFQNTSLEAFQLYFLDNIESILKELKNQLSEDNLAIKIINFVLVEILFARVSIGKDNEINQQLQMAALPGNTSDYKELMRSFLKCTLSTFRENISVTTKNEELLRICRCHCYNTLVSIAVNSLNDPNFHVKLFTRIEGKEDILWRNLVDLKKSYGFEKDFNSLPQKKKVFVNIKKASLGEPSSIDIQTKILRSQRIFNSSLGEDITKHDLNNVALRTEPSSEIKGGIAEIEMDFIQVNDHECMATICALINHLAETSFFNIENEPPELPLCLKGLRNVLLHETTPVNVRIFLVKIIENTSHIFSNYSKWFLTPIMKFIVDKCAGDEMNFFITDLVVMLANWSEKSQPQDDLEQDLAMKVIEFLFDKLSTDRRDIFKYNLELIGILLEAWKTTMSISRSFLMSVLTSSKSEETDKEIQFLSLLLHNNLFIFEADIISDFLTFVGKRLNSSKKAIYMPCSEMLGIFLRLWKEKNVFGNYEDLGIESIMSRIWETDKDKGGFILEGISIHNPEFLQEKHIIRLMSRFASVIPNSQYIFLKVMLRATSVLESVNEFKTEKWEEYINSESSDVQIGTLSLIQKTISILENEPSFRTIIAAVCEKANSPNELCKKLAYEIVIDICSDHLKNPSKFSNVMDICKDVLMDGLAEENQELLQTIRNFWINSNILSNNLSERFIQCFSSIYKPKNEDKVLGTGMNFLLSSLKLDQDFNKLLFDHPLEDCDFEDYELSVNHLTQHPYEVPMFAETFLDSPIVKTENQFKFGEMRATQEDFTFSLTIPSKQDQVISQFLSSQSSLFLETQTFPGNMDNFKDPNKHLKHKILKRRFLKSKAKISDYFANSEVKSKVQKVQNRAKKAKERDRQVCITRKYRKGDFPDIQIPLSSIIEPLQKLATENSDIAKLLYFNLFENLKEKMSSVNWLDLTEIIATIFKTSSEFNSNLLRTLMDFIIASKSKIKLDPYLIVECCLSSSLVSTGTLIIENYLMHMDEAEPLPKKVKGVNTSDECIHWIKLAELYKELNEWDVVCSIFQNKVPCDDIVKKAISTDHKKLWAQAKDLYREVLEKDMNENNRDFYYEAYFRCFANMGQWKKISDTIKLTEGPSCWDNMWEEDWKRKKLLPWYITAEVNDMLFKEELSVDFLGTINKALCENSRAGYLKSAFPEHIAMMWMLNEDLDAAEMYLRSSIDSFLSQWQVLDPMFRSVRFKKILKLRRCTTIYEFIDIYRMFGSIEIEKIFGFLEILWSNTHYAPSYPTMLQEIDILYYKQFLSLIHSKISSLEDMESNSYIERINDWKLKLDLGLVDAALGENNFYLARKYLESHRNHEGVDMYLAKMTFIKSCYTKNPSDTLGIIVKSLDMLEDLSNKEKNKESLLKIHLTVFEILGELSKVLDSSEKIPDNLNEKLERIIGHHVLKSKGFQDYGATRIYQFLEEYDSEEISVTTMSDAYLKVSYYMIEKQNIDVDILNKMVLRSMKLGLAEARQLFPILLQQENLGTLYKSVFEHESTSVPTWMFLNWIPQLLANMNSETIYAIDSIIMRIAENYPQAIMYPYRLSRETFNTDNIYLSGIVERMDSLLLNEDFDRFLKAVGNVCLPEKKLVHYVDKIRKNIGNSEELENIRNFILSEFYGEQIDFNNPKCLYGNVFKRIRDFKKYFQEFKSDRVLNDMEELSIKLKNMGKPKSLLLKDCSPWLANFSSTEVQMEFEIPGQYNGKTMPLPQYHIKIYKFHPEVSVMNSLRKPIKFTILGNNTKEYSYLVKFGEDIRQDQRIEQLFDLMNDIFRKNYSQQFSLETFEVIPLTTSLGIIRWIDKTIMMETFMKRASNKANSLDAPTIEYSRFIFSSKKGVNNNMEAYGESAKVYDRNKVISKYQRAVNEIDKDILRKAFWNLSTSTESFIALRHNFMRSYAVMCVAHWILGIGDRNLSNTLISLEDGHVIGIDFGYAFGTATQMLPVPELIPFRLTPQIVSFMEPLGVMGHFRESMINTMKCLKEYKKLLVATMSVFIKEPSLDWLEIPKLHQESDITNSDWFPYRKINQVKRKLDGINSTEIVIEDLKDGQVKEYANIYCKLVSGMPEYDYRAQIARSGLSVEQQVDCLIDQARDYNLLGRAYVGLRPWV
ncbi:DNA-dependent protein kinase catalytic subunit-like isoform X2 [Coccinella septempunctata]|uniref:DNA-dependent protein kinase catalytic subunit-like isoform X2 n=1 Tax=Coccinella septempunctata TaxID=41139 RepID=UPI001D098010|nr:DNA-dependent protein kinase catalytic subunit-like isoform X2 [Coccinella septempunctata]